MRGECELCFNVSDRLDLQTGYCPSCLELARGRSAEEDDKVKSLTEKALGEIETRLTRRTQGKWCVYHESGVDVIVWDDSDTDGVFVASVPFQSSRSRDVESRPSADLDFIAHAPSDIAALLKEVSRLRKAG